MMCKRSKKKTKSRFYEQSILHACMAKLGSMNNGSLHLLCLYHIRCEQMLILG